MSRELDCAVRTAKAALENLFQVASDEREMVHIYFDDRSGLDLGEAIQVDGNSMIINGWQSSSYQC
ncbi:hypothetical protein PP422_gp133 [Enterobacter phage vB_EhoM-IME523]|jgi:hypothetical protein|uniref:Uncharacterized protein n=3 Tax=Kanagawavirus TaxID=2843399 RepID=A0A6B9XX69_9CAUD|nr:hypothetical protein HWD05_gp241 [Enterobacter phage vB_EclM_CIP9]YP_010650097.1 hypothetical protein PP421_gp140 [Kosakonia phage 305]YP_010650384.1 hypothetical protein PP422_gp133 [Enterobacter phage vB_EhoM-IME523]UTY64370.1 hypothetical protein ENTB45_190 [Enterobacter phage Entb_45]QEA10612.1 hypothetical protein [Enterobacter phage vB_EhoM-IME523]QHS01777.1 hypothetical protein CPT_CIP9_241 [Enterobacter phage vB_EclM_CIP9]QYN80291.1 hypothetical protein [Kosakonia phage 305]